jgi:hypothetical protein
MEQCVVTSVFRVCMSECCVCVSMCVCVCQCVCVCVWVCGCVCESRRCVLLMLMVMTCQMVHKRSVRARALRYPMLKCIASCSLAAERVLWCLAIHSLAAQLRVGRRIKCVIA